MVQLMCQTRWLLVAAAPCSHSRARVSSKSTMLTGFAGPKSKPIRCRPSDFADNTASDFLERRAVRCGSHCTSAVKVISDFGVWHNRLFAQHPARRGVKVSTSHSVAPCRRSVMLPFVVPSLMDVDGFSPMVPTRWFAAFPFGRLAMVLTGVRHFRH
jgi:hypothetical protein